MMVIGSTLKDKDTASITVMSRIGTKATGKTIKKKEREFNTKEATNTKANSKTALSIVHLVLWSL